MMYYQQENLESLTRLLNRFYRNMALIWIVPVLMCAAALIWRIAPLGYAGAVLMAITGTVCWYAVVYRIHCYRHLVRDILVSRDRFAEGTVMAVDGARISRDGSTFIPLQLKAEDPERPDGYERSVFFDTLKGEAPVQVGQQVRLTLFDNIIKEVEILE